MLLTELYDKLPQDLKTHLIDPEVNLYLHKLKFQHCMSTINNYLALANKRLLDMISLGFPVHVETTQAIIWFRFDLLWDIKIYKEWPPHLSKNGCNPP